MLVSKVSRNYHGAAAPVNATHVSHERTDVAGRASGDTLINEADAGEGRRPHLARAWVTVFVVCSSERTERERAGQQRPLLGLKLPCLSRLLNRRGQPSWWWRLSTRLGPRLECSQAPGPGTYRVVAACVRPRGRDRTGTWIVVMKPSVILINAFRAVHTVAGVGCSIK